MLEGERYSITAADNKTVITASNNLILVDALKYYCNNMIVNGECEVPVDGYVSGVGAAFALAGTETGETVCFPNGVDLVKKIQIALLALHRYAEAYLLHLAAATGDVNLVCDRLYVRADPVQLLLRRETNID